MLYFLMADAVVRAISGGAYTGIQNKGAMWISMCIAINYLRCYITMLSHRCRMWGERA